MRSQILATTPEFAQELIDAYNSFYAESKNEVEKARNEASAFTPAIVGDTAIIPITGVLTPRFSFWTWLFGGTAYDSLLEGIQSVSENPNVKRVIFDIDSPGGAFDGIAPVADAIHALEKETIAYVRGRAASAAYWLAAAADTIYGMRASQVGSIGVVATVVDDSKKLEKEGLRRWEIVSSNAPHKRPDVSTKDGRDEIRSMVNDAEDIFITDIAKYRGVDPDTVRQTYGQGRVFFADKAIEAMMIDGVRAFDDLWKADKNPMEGLMGLEELTIEQLSAERPEIVTALREEGRVEGIAAGAEKERERLNALESLAGLDCAEDVISKAKADGVTTAEQAALQIVTAQRKRKGSALENVVADAQELEGVKSDGENSVNEELKAEGEGAELVKLVTGKKDQVGGSHE